MQSVSPLLVKITGSRLLLLKSIGQRCRFILTALDDSWAKQYDPCKQCGENRDFRHGGPCPRYSHSPKDLSRIGLGIVGKCQRPQAVKRHSDKAIIGTRSFTRAGDRVVPTSVSSRWCESRT